MQIALSNVGHRRALSLLEAGHHGDLLVQLLLQVTLPWENDREQHELLAQGWIKTTNNTIGKRTIARQLRCNPLKNISRVAIEFTTHCNFSCAHCYNANVERLTESNLEALAAASDVCVDMGVRAFAFIGGEVSKYGLGWLDLARHLRNRGASVVVLVSNGWFLGRKDFKAAGHRYFDTASYLEGLYAAGITHLCLSIDGPGEDHDRSRRSPGLYDRIVSSFDAVRDAGIEPRVSVLLRNFWCDEHLYELSHQIFGNPDAIWHDSASILSGFIDIGNGASQSADAHYKIREVSPHLLRCAGLYRPQSHLTLKANGELATCRLLDAGEGYGNFHQRPLVDILNGMQDSLIYRLHAKHEIQKYLRFIDPAFFGEGFSSLCTLRAVATMIAMRMLRDDVEFDDCSSISRINCEVARLTGHLKCTGTNKGYCSDI